jgi:hypothetical protein
VEGRKGRGYRVIVFVALVVGCRGELPRSVDNPEVVEPTRTLNNLYAEPHCDLRKGRADERVMLQDVVIVSVERALGSVDRMEVCVHSQRHIRLFTL